MSINTRHSNIELLRIVSMIMVVMLHFNNHGYNTGLLILSDEISSQYLFGHLIESFCIIAVHCFVLISGYCGIRFKVKSLFNLYLDCFFAGMIGYLLWVLLSPEAKLGVSVLGRLFAFSHNHWWFITTYLGLYFLSPTLNYAMNLVSKREGTVIVLLFLLYCLWTYYWNWYNDGMLPLFICLYCIGRYVRRFVDGGFIRNNRWKWLLSYCFCSLITFSFVLLILLFPQNKLIHRFDPYNYYALFIIVAAVSMLLFSLSFSFNSKIVNRVASSCLSVYLLQESPYFGYNVLYPWVESVFPTLNHQFFFYVGISLTFFLCAVLIGLFIQFFCSPIRSYFETIIEPKMVKFYVWKVC